MDTILINEDELAKSNKEKNKLIFEQIKNGNEEAKNKFIEDNINLVKFVVFRYFRDSQIPKDDLIQEGILSLMRNLEGFDPSYDTAFSTYMVPHLFRDINKYDRRNKQVQTVGYTALDYYYRIRRILIENNIEELNPENIKLIASKANLNENKILELLQINTINKSLEDYVSTSSDEDKDCVHFTRSLIAKQDDMLDCVFLEQFKELALLAKVKPRNLDIFLKAQGIDYDFISYEELGEKYGVSRQRIYEIVQKTQHKLVKNPKIRNFFEK